MLHGAAAPDRTEAEAIVGRYGRTPLDYFKLWPDKLYFFSSSHASVVAYRVAWSIAISLGDPVGPAEELPSVVRSFVDFCAGRGWRAAFHQVALDLLAVYRLLGFAVVKIGEEALVDLERFATQTSQQRSFRKPTRHLEAQGYASRARSRLIPRHCSTKWKRSRENGFRCRGAVNAPLHSAGSIETTWRGVRSSSLAIGPVCWSHS